MPDQKPDHLLSQYARTRSDATFQTIVDSYVDLVHSAAVRLMNGDEHLARDVTQAVFIDLARLAPSLSPEVALGGWLHRHTCYIASNTRRAAHRRQVREQQAAEMNANDNDAPADIALVAPILDDAINELRADDRQAIMLRFFEQKDFRSVGEGLGTNEEAARKRVHRALDKLRGLLGRRGVTLSATTLGATLGAHAVSAAPVGLAAAITASALATAASATGASVLFQVMTITKLQGGVIAALAIAAVAIPLTFQRQANRELQDQNEALRAQVATIGTLSAENSRLSNLLARASSRAPVATGNEEQFRELMKLRGEVSMLRNAAGAPAATPSAPSALSSLSDNPEMGKMLRDQQKMGLGTIYKGLAKRANLPPEKVEQLNEVLADNVMTNIAHITVALRDGATPAQMEPIFAQQEADLNDKVRELLGDEGFAEYQDYTRNLASYISAQQFKSMMLTGDDATKEQQGKQLFELLQDESQKVLAGAGLSQDFQLVPTLNFRNFASEQEGEKNLQLLDSVYERASARATTFLSPQELEKFAEFRKIAINNNRLGLAVNRKMMAPPAK